MYCLRYSRQHASPKVHFLARGTHLASMFQIGFDLDLADKPADPMLLAIKGAAKAGTGCASHKCGLEDTYPQNLDLSDRTSQYRTEIGYFQTSLEGRFFDQSAVPIRAREIHAAERIYRSERAAVRRLCSALPE